MAREEEPTCQPSPCVITGGAVSGEVPATEAFAIHYPGYPSSTSRAIQTLGGIDRISEVRANANARLRLRFRPEDPYSHPAFGDHRISNSLLLKLTKSRRTDPEELRAEIVARVVSSYQFEGMVDYQYVVPVHAAVESGSRKRKCEVGLSQCNTKKKGLLGSDEGEIMMLVPQLFSLKDIPQRVVLKPPANLFSRNMQISVVQQSWEMQIETCMAIDFNIERSRRWIARVVDGECLGSRNLIGDSAAGEHTWRRLVGGFFFSGHLEGFGKAVEGFLGDFSSKDIV